MPSSKQTICSLVLIFLSSAGSTQKDYCSKSGGQCCRPFAAEEFNQTSRSIFMIRPQGRLGNHITAFAHLYQLREELGVDVYMESETKDLMGSVFSDATLQVMPVYEEEFCNFDSIPLKEIDLNIPLLLQEKTYRQGQTLSLRNKPNQGTKIYEDYVARLTASMKSVLHFRTEILEKVWSKMEKIAVKFWTKHPTMKPETPITWIGIHNRRTDLNDYAWKKHGLVPLEEEYFVEAMDYYRERFGEAVIFLYVSDDMKWGRQNLMNPKRDLFFVGNGKTEDMDEIALDMTTLAQCNHSITTRGTFGIWTAILAGGLVHHEGGVTDDLFHV